MSLNITPPTHPLPQKIIKNVPPEMNEGLRTWLDNQPDQQALQAQTD